MSDSVMPILKEAAQAAMQSQCVEEAMLHLSRAFSLFSDESQQLKNAYENLQQQLKTVNMELKRQAARSEGLARYLANVLKHISDAILFVDLEGTVILFNSSAQKLLNKDPESVLFKKFSTSFADDAFGFSMKECLAFGISHKLLYCKEMEVSTTFIHQGPKNHQGMIVVLKDLREKQKLQLTIARNERMKQLGQVAASVAHEIRNPLGGIRGYASLLWRDLEHEPHLQEMTGHILEGTKSLEKAVTAILHFSKPIDCELQTMDLCAYLKKTIGYIKVDPAYPPNVRFHLHIPNSPILVPLDAALFKSALLNLAFNAFQAMPSGGLLTLALIKNDTSCQISLTDTGIGMDEEQLKQLFSPFFTTKKKGNGLGLVETKKIVDAHFGSIDVRSTPKVGSTFTITLPLSREMKL